MEKMTIENPDMLELLPAFMKEDDTNAALSSALDHLIADAAKRAKIISKWNQIDNMSSAELDEMAWEFDIDWWDSSFDVETKKNVVKTCYRIHQKRGTKYAVEELVKSVFGFGEVIEWFEYDGKPFMFKIKTNATLTKDGMAYFIKMIDKVKSARSKLEMIEVIRQIKLMMNVGAALSSYSKSVIIDTFAETYTNYVMINSGIGTSCIRKSIIREA